MVNFVLGFFREYWPVVLTCAFARYGAPIVAEWLDRITDGGAPRGGTERHSDAD